MEEELKLVYLVWMRYDEPKVLGSFDTYEKAEECLCNVAHIFTEEAVARKVVRPHFYIEVRRVS